MPDAIRHAVSDPGHHHATVGVADQDDAREFFCRDEARDVTYVRVHRDLRRHEMGTLPEAGQRRGPHGMAKRPQPCRNVPPDPATSISPMHEDVGVGRDDEVWLLECSSVGGIGCRRHVHHSAAMRLSLPTSGRQQLLSREVKFAGWEGTSRVQS